MATVSFFSDAQALVSQGLRALPLLNPGVALDEANRIVYRRTHRDDGSNKVSIVSGGGSGHEPGFAGYVGRGLLDASVAGTVFASPSSEQIRRAIGGRVPTDPGVLVLTMNYTGDVLNFGVAVEKARAQGISTEMVVVADDVAVGRAKGGKVGRRGIAGTVLVMKILGALAERGGTLAELHQLGLALSRNLASIGASLRRVTVPGREPPSPAEQVPYGQVEVGMGIHNESGTGRVTADLPQLVETMLSCLLDPKDEDRHYIDITSSDQVVLLVNNLGGLSPLELSAVAHEVCTQARQQYNIVPIRVLCGTFLTAFNAPGWSVSLLKDFATDLGPGRSILELLDAPAQTPVWPSVVDYSPFHRDHECLVEPSQPVAPASEPLQSNLSFDPDRATAVLSQALENVIAAEPKITHFDSIVGDGDCGIGLKRGSDAILKHLTGSPSQSTDLVAFLNGIAGVIETNMDGTSGAIIAIFISALSAALRNIGAQHSQPTSVDVQVWIQALRTAVQSLGKYTPARLGDRTLLDSLIPFVETLASTADVHEAARAAAKSADATKLLEPQLGRTTYIGSREKWFGVIPDPGAIGLSKFFSGLADAF